MPEELDVLGKQLELALQFVESGFEDAVLHDPVLCESVNAHTLFSQELDGVKTSHWHMRNESMPGHFAIKAIAVDNGNLFLETAPLNPNEVESTIVERMLPVRYSEKDGAFVDTTTMKPLVHVGRATTVKRGGVTFARRSLWRIDLEKLDSVRKQAAITLIDALFANEAFDLTGMEQEPEPHRESHQSGPRLELRLQMQMLHQLRVEQRPLLVNTLHLQSGIGTGTRTELQTVLRLQQMIFHMQAEELVDFAAKYLAEHGEAKAKGVLIFVLAGRVKQAVPNLSWKEARRISRRIASRPA